MDKLKQILKERKFNIKDDALEAKVREYGYDPAKLSDQDVQVVADELTKEKGAIAVQPPKAQGSKPPSGDTESLKRALLHGFGERKKELEAFTGQLDKYRQDWMNEWVQSNLSTIRNTSNDAFEMLKAELLKEEANAESFLRAADELATELFVAQ